MVVGIFADMNTNTHGAYKKKGVHRKIETKKEPMFSHRLCVLTQALT